jgi:hypothetical protein
MYQIKDCCTYDVLDLQKETKTLYYSINSLNQMKLHTKKTKTKTKPMKPEGQARN